MDSHTLRVEWVETDSLFCSPSNPRVNDAAVPHVAASIQRFDWWQPIVAKLSGEVIAGNTRLKAAQSLGLPSVPVVRFEGSDVEALAYAIADNRSHEHSSWDESSLAEILKTLRVEDALDAVGFDEEEVDALLAGLEEAKIPADVDDPGPELPPTDPVSRPGDLWLLGQHRLLCGDATDARDVARLMVDDRARLLATDPPYCVGYTGAERPQDSGKDWSDVYNEVDIKDLGQFLRAVLTATLPHLRDNAALYVWHAHLQYPAIDDVLQAFGILRHQPVIWVKPASTFTYSYYRWAHEPCLFGWKQGHKPPHYLKNALSTVWEVDYDGKGRQVGNEHPTQKPTRLFEIPMEQHTRAGNVVLEPFCGSGSQIIAAERLGRCCRALEIVPAFVDVAVVRWMAATGQEAVLEATGARWTDVEASRRAATPASEGER